MRIAMDATTLYGRFGGTSHFIWNLMDHLARVDTANEYLVYVASDAPEPPPTVQAAGWRWEWRRLPFTGDQKMRRIRWQQTELPLQLLRDGCGLIHCPAYVMPLLSSVPAVVTMHDLIALNHSRYARRGNRIHYRAVMPQTMKRAARLLVSTERTRWDILRRVPEARERIRLVPMGVDELFFDPAFVSETRIEAVRQKYQLPPKFLLYVGNFEPKKNLPNLLRAVAMLEEAPPLVIAGGVNPWPGYDGLKGRARVIGYVEREELPALFASCEVFCFPSLSEGFGFPVVEAMASGAPVLASHDVPLPRLCEVAAVAPARVPHALAAALRELLAHPERRVGIAERGREYAAQFRWESHAAKTLEIYRELGAR